MYFILVVLVSVAKIITIECMGHAGPVGEVKVFYITECEPPIEKDVVVETFLENVGEDEKAFNMKVKVPYDIDENTEFILLVDKWVDGNWQKDFYKTDGNMFEYINKFVPKIWKHVRDSVEPPLTSDVMIEKGEYELKHFQEVAENLELPQILYGRFKLYYYIIVDNVEIACRMAELESISKNNF